MLEIFIIIVAVIALSLIGYISIMHNNHKAKVKELKRALELNRRTIEQYLFKELRNELRNNDHAHMSYKAMWEELRKDVNDAINNPSPKVKPIVKASVMKVFENTLDDMDRLEKEFLNEKN